MVAIHRPQWVRSFSFSCERERMDEERESRLGFGYGERRQPFGRETTKPSVVSPTNESECGERVLTEHHIQPINSLSSYELLLLRRRTLWHTAIESKCVLLMVGVSALTVGIIQRKQTILYFFSTSFLRLFCSQFAPWHLQFTYQFHPSP